MIHSSSDGSTVDIQPPYIVITTVGLFGAGDHNDTESWTDDDLDLDHQLLTRKQRLYQKQLDSIDLRWNATDTTSDVANVTWMAGSLPGMDDKHSETLTDDYEVFKF